MRKRLLLALLSVLAFPAFAALAEVENNGSLSAANVLGLSGNGTVNIVGTISTNSLDGLADYDYFRLGSFGIGGVITAQTSATFDTYIGLYNAAGALVITDDDSGGGLNSLFTYNVTSADVYTLVVRGFGSNFSNDPFSLTPGNPIGDTGSYTTTVTWRGAEGTVPEPSSLALFGIALAGIGATRRKKSTTT
jgi:hypothetical protein